MMASGASSPPAKKPKTEATAAASSSAAPEGVGNLDNYSIEWSMQTSSFSEHSRAHDFCRTAVKGKLIFSGGGEGDETEVGSMSATQYRMHYMGNRFIDKFEVFDETSEGGELYTEVVRDLDEGCTDEGQGDVQVIERMVVDPAHRGHRLGLFMIEAANEVINGHMSVQIVNPFPLQFETDAAKQLWGRCGFPEPPGETEGDAHPGRQAAFTDARARLSTYYARLGFKTQGTTQFMLRWNGCQNPPLDQAMRK